MKVLFNWHFCCNPAEATMINCLFQVRNSVEILTRQCCLGSIYTDANCFGCMCAFCFGARACSFPVLVEQFRLFKFKLELHNGNIASVKLVLVACVLSVLCKSLLLLLNNLLPPCGQELDVQCRNPQPTILTFTFI